MRLKNKMDLIRIGIGPYVHNGALDTQGLSDLGDGNNECFLACFPDFPFGWNHGIHFSSCATRRRSVLRLMDGLSNSDAFHPSHAPIGTVMISMITTHIGIPLGPPIMADSFSCPIGAA